MLVNLELIQNGDTMPLTMTRPTKHPETGVFRLRKAIPAALRAEAERLFGVKREFITSLGVKDAASARRLAPAALAEIDRKLDLCRQSAGTPPQALSHMQCVALAGEWRRERLALNEANPGTLEAWEAEKDRLLIGMAYGDEYAPTPHDIAEAEALAVGRGITADAPSLRALAQALWLAKVQFAETMMRRAARDYGADEYAERYPALSSASVSRSAVVKTPGEAVLFESLIRGFCRDKGVNPDASPIPEDFDRRRRFAKHLAAFLGHDDPRAVTAQDAVRWKESLLDGGKSLGTVANHLSALSAVWAWGVTNKKTEINPFQGLAKPPKKVKGARESSKRPYTAAEATRVLQAARRETKATLRWAPWVLALTGARLAEVIQARKEDVKHKDGFPFLSIHENKAEAGEVRSVKNGASIRNVPIHPALAAEGFLKYVEALPAGSPLFPDSKPDARYGNRARTATKAMSKWMRDTVGITDEAISPSHSWRHWFMDAARECIENLELRNALTGHTDDVNESHRYGLGYREKPERLYNAVALIALPSIPGDKGH